jgi:hypothetical protein
MKLNRSRVVVEVVREQRGYERVADTVVVVSEGREQTLWFRRRPIVLYLRDNNEPLPFSDNDNSEHNQSAWEALNA